MQFLTELLKHLLYLNKALTVLDIGSFTGDNFIGILYWSISNHKFR